TGGGTIVLSDRTTNYIRGRANTYRLINVNNTISGAGHLGQDYMGLTNEGLIDANQSNTLTIDPSTVAGATNTGTMQASSGGTLKLLNGTFTNTGGTIQALDASVLELSGATVTGGEVRNVAGGQMELYNSTISGGALINSTTGIIRATGSTTTIETALTNPAGGRLIIANGQTLKLGSAGSYYNEGEISLESSG
ncbi:unnamed protein product, partial [marine sediment metagenome]